jgi:hypothetical protein
MNMASGGDRGCAAGPSVIHRQHREHAMDLDQQRQEVDRNYDFFMRTIDAYLADHKNEFALIRDAGIVGFFPTVRAAGETGDRLFSDGRYSIQEVTLEPIDLGIFSHAGH